MADVRMPRATTFIASLIVTLTTAGHEARRLEQRRGGRRCLDHVRPRGHTAVSFSRSLRINRKIPITPNGAATSATSNPARIRKVNRRWPKKTLVYVPAPSHLD